MRALGGMLASLRLTARLQGDMSRVCWPEPATAEVERAEVVFKIDVKPPAPSSPGVLRGNGDKPGPDPLPPHSCGNEGVQQERVDGPSQATFDEAKQVTPFPRAGPAQAVLVYLGAPVVVKDWVAKRLGVQGVDWSASWPWPGLPPRIALQKRAALRFNVRIILLTWVELWGFEPKTSCMP
jgi:hypothetical protein